MVGLLKAILLLCIFYSVAARSLQPKCGSEDFIKPHRYLCNLYYVCKDGELEVEECPEGKLFNSSTLQCDKKENVDCGKLIIPGAPSKKNRLLEDLLDLYYLKGVVDVADMVGVNSKFTYIDNNMDF